MKQFLFQLAVIFKKPSIIGRLILLGGSLLLLTFIFIPDLKFNLQIKNPKKLTIEEIKKTPKEELPRYIILDQAELMTVKSPMNQSQVDSLFGDKTKIKNSGIILQQQSYNYVVEQQINKQGDTILSSISYPVYSKSEIKKNPKASASDLTSYVIIRDSGITEKMLKEDKYFTDSTFAIKGLFDGSLISDENLKLLQDGGYKVSKDAIVLRKGSSPMSLTSSIVLSLAASWFAMFCFLGFLPMNMLCKIFAIEEEVVKLK